MFNSRTFHCCYVCSKIQPIHVSSRLFIISICPACYVVIFDSFNTNFVTFARTRVNRFLALLDNILTARQTTLVIHTSIIIPLCAGLIYTYSTLSSSDLQSNWLLHAASDAVFIPRCAYFMRGHWIIIIAPSFIFFVRSI